MKQWIRCVFLLIFTLVSSSAAAQMAQNFTVENIFVDEAAENPTAAREKAITMGQLQGLQQLLPTLVNQNDIDRLPKVNAESIDQLVQSFTVTHVKITGNRYEGRLNVTYNPAAVRKYLATQGVKEMPIARPSILVIPVFEKEGVTQLWEANNAWKSAWYKIAAEEKTIQFAVPLGDLEDVQVFNADILATGDYGPLVTLANRYGAREIMIAKAIIESSAGYPSLRVEIIPVGEGRTIQSLKDFRSSYNASDGSVLEAAVKDITQAMKAGYEERSVQASKVAGETFEANIAIANLQEWIHIRGKLEAFPLIKEMDVLKLETDKVRVRITFSGTFDAFTEALGDYGFALFEDSSGWLIKLL